MITKDLIDILRSIDLSLQLIAQRDADGTPIALVSKKTMASKLGVQPVVIDKLIHTGIASKGKSGLVEGEHYCKLLPGEENTNNFLFDPAKVLKSAWNSFQQQ